MTRSCNRKTNAASEHPVTAALQELAAHQITVRLVTSEEEPRWNKWVRKHHYLKEHRLVGESLKYVAQQDGQVIAALGWSSAAYHLQPRDRYIGWSAPQRQARRHWVACNARFLLLGPKGHVPNAASQILSRNLECLSQDWQDRYGHPILLVETFVDPQQFQGTCYRAANWTQIGATKGWGRARLDFYQLHRHPKAIFVCELHPKARQLLCAPELPPKLQAVEHANPRQPTLSLRQSKSLLAALDGLPDPRSRQGQRHRQVSSILAIAAAAMIANNNSFSAIGQFAQALNQKELRSLRASRDRRTGRYLAPSESTIRRTIQGLDPGEGLGDVADFADWTRVGLHSVNPFHREAPWPRAIFRDQGCPHEENATPTGKRSPWTALDTAFRGGTGNRWRSSDRRLSPESPPIRPDSYHSNSRWRRASRPAPSQRESC